MESIKKDCVFCYGRQGLWCFFLNVWQSWWMRTIAASHWCKEDLVCIHRNLHHGDTVMYSFFFRDERHGGIGKDTGNSILACCYNKRFFFYDLVHKQIAPPSMTNRSIFWYAIDHPWYMDRNMMIQLRYADWHHGWWTEPWQPQHTRIMFVILYKVLHHLRRCTEGVVDRNVSNSWLHKFCHPYMS